MMTPIERLKTGVVFDPEDGPDTDANTVAAMVVAVKEGNLEVSCPWWPTDHWEDKTITSFTSNCTYRTKR